MAMQVAFSSSSEICEARTLSPVMGVGNVFRAGCSFAKGNTTATLSLRSFGCQALEARVSDSIRFRNGASSLNSSAAAPSLGFGLKNAGLSRGFSSDKRWFKWNKQGKAAAATKDSAAEKAVAEQKPGTQQEDKASEDVKKPPPVKKNNNKPKQQQSTESSGVSKEADQQKATPETKSNAGSKNKNATKAKQPETEAAKPTPSKKPAEITKATQKNEGKNKDKPSTSTEVKEGDVKKTPPKKTPPKKPKPAVEIAAKAAAAKSNSNAVSTKKVVVKDEVSSFTHTGKTVVVVESPAKAKTIEKYLGANFQVVASYGHIRDLAARSGSVRPQDDFDLVWEVPDSAKSHFNRIKSALKGAQAVVLASDPDREGEAIAWHVFEMLKIDGVLHPEVKIQRVTFNEITKPAVLAGMNSPREISQTLVDAYLARRALDYLIGFDISPLLWRKLPGSKSAGRVQSAALCLLSEREKEIESFTPREYWTVETEISPGDTEQSVKFPARLISYKSSKLEQFTLTAAEAEAAAACISKSYLQVQNVKNSVIRRNSPGPYITSTLQQDASSKLGFGASKTMSLAQKLYEGVGITKDELVGLITYMRTDSQQLSQQAVDSIRSFGEEKYGKEYVPESARVFKSKVKNAQESHEAIRPTDIQRLPSSLEDVLEPDALRLYALIWRRTMACQLMNAVFNHVALDVGDPEGNLVLRSTASSVEFPGYQIVFKDKDALAVKEDNNEEVDTKLPPLKIGRSMALISVQHKQHFTEPPPRYTEGSLVKKMEELGIGRPSTYAHILRTLQLREYMKLEKQRIFPQLRGRMVAAFLSRYFAEFVDYGFTAKMEEQLDSISAGSAEWKEVMKQFWPNFHAKVASTSQVPIKQVADMLAKMFSDKFAGNNKTCPDCHLGELELKLTKFGAGYFLGCNRYPSCHYCNSLEDEDEEEATGSPVLKTRNRVLGMDPATGLPVQYREGPYGDFIQIGEDSKGKLKPKRIRLPTSLKADEVDLELALELMKYPKELGQDSEGKEVTVGIGKLGCYIRRDGYSVFVPKDQKVEDLTLESALEIFKKGKEDRRKIRKSPISLGHRYVLSSQA